MALDLLTVPCLRDNYAYIVRGPKETRIIDAPEAGPILAALKAAGLTPTQLLITHHHHDHNDGVAGLRAAFPDLVVMGPAAEADKMPAMDRLLAEGDSLGDAEELCEVIAVPGHTLGHIAFHLPQAQMVFTADSLMAMGCGRVFEGTFPMMHESLSKLAALPPETLVCSGHEYTQSNARFALTIEPGNAALISRTAEIDAARAEGRPTVPSLLSLELATNPFLRAHLPEVALSLGLAGASPAEVFAEIRRRKDSF
ncbi:hydroxyacylglutathione hydrolase [Pseudooceanicola sp. CBS1P-1]|uniref:Hydroxyacylglutathione hydrolase n=1 Tax=Pseudooceanicola albus TaxID=2692189 RepID=A0A6L7G3U8_9RHOB|nr:MULTISPECIES: hydroxyacylglutathione hydrolase [Pseudooceanicola]MBT9384651.1 hydroxyacylglutathione hydrolase [Pseudooceanicola endophyticus]MXN18352.1 hydroxyacylglutathione hydrolase [Pseudooceanicola albus]